MSMVQIALRRPYTFIVMAILIVLATPFALGTMATDIFPEIDIPVISIVWNYNGLSLQARGLAPADVVNSLNLQNLILPSGTAKFGPTEYTVRMNGSPDVLLALNDLPVRTTAGTTTYLRDVAYVRDGYTPQTNVVRQD